MNQDPRDRYRYTPLFCEENIWWLAHDLRGRGDLGQAFVCVISNAAASVALLNQRAADPGAPMAWDYHVILVTPDDGGWRVYDFDSRLAFPKPWREYLRQTFPEQDRLPSRWRSQVRLVPADRYLARFCSDRRHMVGVVPLSAFPKDPPICPDDPDVAITLDAYRDMTRRLDDGSRVVWAADLGPDPV
jgi:hypothetical protein